MKFMDVKVGQRIKLGSLVWVKIDPITTGPWLPQNVVYQRSEPPYRVHTGHVDSDEDVEVVD